MHWIFTNLKTLKKHGFKFFQSDKGTTIEFHLLHALKAKKTWIYYETIRRHVFFKIRNLPVIFLQAGKTQEYEDFFCELKKLKKLQLNFLEVKFFQKTNTWIQFFQDSKSSKNMDLFFFAS